MMKLQPRPSAAPASAGASAVPPDGTILALDLGTTTGWALRAPTA